MAYIVYVESDLATVPHMEPLTADCPTAAAAEALEHHSHAIAAHVYEEGACVASVRREEAGLNP